MIAKPMTRSTFSHALCALTLLAATAAQAAPVSLGACGVSDLGNGIASDCAGYAIGNDSVSALQALVGQADWHGLALSGLTQYKDGTVGVGSTNALFDVQQSPTDASQGRLAFLQTLNGPAVLTLKGGANWAAYFLPQGGVAGSSIDFNIPGVQGAGLSHASVYTAATPTLATPLPAVAVPEPSGLALALLGLGGMAVSLGQRRRSAMVAARA